MLGCGIEFLCYQGTVNVLSGHPRWMFRMCGTSFPTRGSHNNIYPQAEVGLMTNLEQHLRWTKLTTKTQEARTVSWH